MPVLRRRSWRLLAGLMLVPGVLVACGTSQSGSSSVATCGAGNLRLSDRGPAFGEETRKEAGNPPVVTVQGRIPIDATSPCMSADWQLLLNVNGVAIPISREDSRPAPVGTYPAGERFTFTVVWPGPGDLNSTTAATLTVNGAEIPLELSGWTNGPVTWRGPEIQSNRTGEPTPYSGLSQPSSDAS